MINSYIRAATGELVKALDYLPLEQQSIESSVFIMHRSNEREQVVLELINADALSPEAIKDRLENNSNNIFNLNSNTLFFIIEVLVFNTMDAQKLQLINDFNEAVNNKFLGLITIDLTEKIIDMHTDQTNVTIPIENALQKVLSSDYITESETLDIEQIVIAKQNELRIDIKAKTPWVTYTLLGLNILIFAALYIYSYISGVSYSQLLDTYGAKDNLRILNGEYWRFLTPIFLHADFAHILINSFSLFSLGRVVEKIYGNFKYGVVYLIAGIIGSIASFIFSVNFGVGASGAIFGLVGALLYFGIENPAPFKRYFGYNIIITLAINIFYGLSNKHIDNFAHLGGLLGGFLAAGIVKLKATNKRYLSRPVFITLTALVMLSGLYYGFNSPQNMSLQKLNNLQRLSEQKKYIEAEKTANEILQIKNNSNEVKLKALWYLSVSQASQNKLKEAIENAKQIAALSPTDGQYILGVMYYYDGQYNNAKQELTKANQQASPYKEQIDKLLAEIDKINKITP